MMDEEKKTSVIERVDAEIEKLKSGSCTFFFYVMDSKGVMNDGIAYEYEIAKHLHDCNYNVVMMYLGNKEDFVGVREWLGDEYADLPHKSSSEESISVSPSDFVFIPDAYSDVMRDTANFPCKRIAVVTDYDHIAQTVPLGKQWGDYGIMDAVTVSETMKGRLNEIFPYLRVSVINPFVGDEFYDDGEPKKLQVAILSKYPNDVNSIVKPFSWKYPVYRWVTFMDLRGLSMEEMAESIRESAISVWIDDEDCFGLRGLQALKSGSILIAKVPEMIPEWMLNADGTINDSGLYFSRMDDIHRVIAMAVSSWINDMIPEDYFEIAGSVSGDEKYSRNAFAESVSGYAKKMIDVRIDEYTEFKNEALR